MPMKIRTIKFLKIYISYFGLGTIHLRRRQFFHAVFDPYPSAVGSFLLLSVGKFLKFLTPSPLKNADVLNGWSLTMEPCTM